MIRKCLPIPQTIYRITKRLKTPNEVKQFSRLSFIDCTGYQIPRPIDKERKNMCYLDKKKKHAIKMKLMVNNQDIIIHKTNDKKVEMQDYDIHKENHPMVLKQFVAVIDLG